MVTEPSDEAELVMPYVTYDDGTPQMEAYVHGAEMSMLDTLLGIVASFGTVRVSRYVHTINLRQLDLVAMRHGLRLESEEWEDDPEWSWATFTNE